MQRIKNKASKMSSQTAHQKLVRTTNLNQQSKQTKQAVVVDKNRKTKKPMKLRVFTLTLSRNNLTIFIMGVLPSPLGLREGSHTYS